MKVEKPPIQNWKDKEINMTREKNLSNRVFSLGTNRDSHKKFEKEAKDKRQKSKGGNEKKKNYQVENKAKDKA